MVHQNQGSDRGAERRQVPGVLPHRCGEPARAEAEQQAAAAQQVRDQSGSCVVALELRQGPAFGQRVVDERHRSQRLQTGHAHREHAQEAVPGGEVGFAAQVLVVSDGCQTQGCTAHAEALESQVNSNFGLVRERLDRGAVRREEQDGFRHEEGKLVGRFKKKKDVNIHAQVFSIQCD